MEILRIVEDLGISLPVTLGHEIAGRIEEVGDEVIGYSKGDLVVANPWEGMVFAYMHDPNINNIVTAELDDETKTPKYKFTIVNIYKVS